MDDFAQEHSELKTSFGFVGLEPEAPGFGPFPGATVAFQDPSSALENGNALAGVADALTTALPLESVDDP